MVEESMLIVVYQLWYALRHHDRQRTGRRKFSVKRPRHPKHEA